MGVGLHGGWLDGDGGVGGRVELRQIYFVKNVDNLKFEVLRKVAIFRPF